MKQKNLEKSCQHFFKISDVVTGEIACRNCAQVLTEKIIDFGPESQNSTMEDYQNSSRTGQKISLKMADMGLSTSIQSQNKDSSGKILSTKNKQSFHRLRMWDRNSKSAITKQSFIKAFTFLDGIRSKIALPEYVVEKSAYLFRKAEQKKLLAGRSNLSILCAVVYMACRMTDTPRTLDDIANASGIKKKVIQRTYRLLYRNLEVHSESYNPCEFVSRISSEAQISEKTIRDARKILEFSEKAGINSGKHPMSMAAAAVYLAVKKNDERISQTRLSQISGISAVTIRNRVKEVQIAQTKNKTH